MNSFVVVVVVAAEIPGHIYGVGEKGLYFFLLGDACLDTRCWVLAALSSYLRFEFDILKWGKGIASYMFICMYSWMHGSNID